MINVSITCKDVNIDLTINKKSGEIAVGKLPANLSRAALQDLRLTLTATKNLLERNEFWQNKSINVSDANALIIATNIKNAVISDPKLKKSIKNEVLKLADDLSFIQYECEINTPLNQLKNNTPLTIDKKGLKCDNIGQDYARLIMQQEVDIDFEDPKLFNLSIGASLSEKDINETKKRSFHFISNIFQTVYEVQQFESKEVQDKLSSLKEEINKASSVTIMGGVIAQNFFVLSGSKNPYERTIAQLIFMSLSQELKNNMAEPFVSAKSILKIAAPNMAIDRPEQQVKIKKEEGKIIIERTIIFDLPHGVKYKPVIKAEIDPAQGIIQKVSMDRKVHFSDKFASEQKASEYVNLIKKSADEHHINIDLTLMDRHATSNRKMKTRPSRNA